jgi:hypothetical protein
MKGKKLFTTINQEEFVSDLGKMTDADVARKYNIFYRTVMNHRKKLGIPRHSINRIPNEEEFKKNVEKFPNTELAKMYGVSKELISEWRKKLGTPNIWKIDMRNDGEFKKDAQIMRWKDLCRKYGVTWSTAKLWKKTLGVTTGKKEDRQITYNIDGGGCWICASHKTDSMGYPQGNAIKGRGNIGIVMWCQKNGIWPNGMVMMHSCDNRLCINPDHISPGTKKQNSEDMANKDRSCWGWRNGARKLNPEQAKEIYALRGQGLSTRDVGHMYGVSGTTVWGIWHRKVWWRDNSGIENFPVKFNAKIYVKHRKGIKLKYDDVVSIRKCIGKMSKYKIAKMYGVTWRTVNKICTNQSWKEG